MIGYYAPTSRFGTPQDFMFLMDACHQNGIGVIVDWVPAHFPKDAHGLAFFDGTALYEHADPRMGEHRDWGTLIFNYGRNEVRTFLISNAVFWLKKYHIDGLRVDAVASMLYLDYSRKAGRVGSEPVWRQREPGSHRLAPQVQRSGAQDARRGHDRRGIHRISRCFEADLPQRARIHDEVEHGLDARHARLLLVRSRSIASIITSNITFSFLYAFTENFVLPISHDEVVHGKGSLLGKMPGDEWQRFANARAFLAYMWAHPGKKLLFMGSEIGSPGSGTTMAAVPWDLLQYDLHRKLQTLVKELNRLYRSSRRYTRWISTTAVSSGWTSMTPTIRSSRSSARAENGRSCCSAATSLRCLVRSTGSALPKRAFTRRS